MRTVSDKNWPQSFVSLAFSLMDFAKLLVLFFKVFLNPNAISDLVLRSFALSYSLIFDLICYLLIYKDSDNILYINILQTKNSIHKLSLTV